MTTTKTMTCQFCGAVVEGADLDAFCDEFLAHVRSVHSDFPYPDQAVRNFAEGALRLTGGTERLAAIGAVTVERVTRDRIDDWLDFFDHDAAAGTPQFAACYCSEPHVLDPKVAPEDQPARTARENRDTMIALLEQGRSFGYLAYVDARPAGWVNASLRSEYRQYARARTRSPPTATSSESRASRWRRRTGGMVSPKHCSQRCSRTRRHAARGGSRRTRSTRNWSIPGSSGRARDVRGARFHARRQARVRHGRAPRRLVPRRGHLWCCRCWLSRAAWRV